MVGLIEQGHQGEITIYSRSGYFPSVRGTQGRITPKRLTHETLSALARTNRKLRIQDLVTLVLEEISLQGGQIPPNWTHPRPPQDVATFLRDEIAAAAEDRIWQAVLYSTNGIIGHIWSVLHEDEKTEFLTKYLSVFMAYRVSIPLENAIKLLSYLESGQLFFKAGNFNVEINSDKKPFLLNSKNHDDNKIYDYVINATGSPRSVNNINSELLSNLLKRGVMVSHEFGGIQIDADSYQVIDIYGQASPQLRVVGELTNGTFFFTSALDINARHARLAALRFSKTFRENNGEFRNTRLSLLSQASERHTTPA